MGVKVADLLDAVVDAKREQSDWSIAVNANKYTSLYSLCFTVDDILDECDGDSVTVDVTDDLDVVISVVVPSFIYETKFKPKEYIDLIRLADKVKFQQCEDGSVKSSFVFSGVLNSK